MIYIRRSLLALVLLLLVGLAAADDAAAEGSAAVAFGHNADYTLGAGYSTRPGETTSVSVLGPSNIPSLSSGYDFTLALLSDGTVRSWGGGNVRGELGNGERGPEEVEGEEVGGAHETENGPVQTVKVLKGATAVVARGLHALALEGERVYTWGDNEYGERGNGELNPHTCENPPQTCENGEKTMQGTGSDEPVSESGLEGVTAIGAGSFTDFAAKRTGTGEEVLAWGDNEKDELGMGEDGSGGKTPEGCKNEFAQKGKVLSCSTKPVKVKGLPASLANGETHVVQIAGGEDFTLVLLSDGTVWSWGENAHGQLGTKAVKTYGSTLETRTDEAKKVEISEVTQISAGSAFALAIAHGGQVYGWGADTENVLGETTHENCSSPTSKTEHPCIVTPAKLTGFNAEGRKFASVAAGYAFTLAATTGGEVYSVGRNLYGELGRGRTLGWPTKAKTETEKTEEAEEIAAEEKEDQEVRVATGVPHVTTLAAGNRFVVALLAPGETAPASQLTLTAKPLELEANWTFSIEAGEEWVLRWFTYETCAKGGAKCKREKVGPSHTVSSTEHSFSFTEVENTKPHRVVMTGGKHSAQRTRYIWGEPLP